MKEFFKSKVFKAIICVFALIFGIIIYQAASGNYASFSEAAVGTIVTPIVKISATVSEKVGGFFNMLLSAQSTHDENAELKGKLAKAYEKLSDYEKYKNENKELKKYLEIKENNPDYKMEPASVIGRDDASIFGTFTINKGSINGVEINDPVITSDGLVGIVSHVAPTYSKVTTILDPSINIGVYNSRIQATGVVSGETSLCAEGKTKLKLLPRDTALLSGDIIETSGIGGIFPEGILLGTIDGIKAENSGVSMYAEIKPMVDVKKVTDVMIITDFSEETVKTEEPVQEGEDIEQNENNK